MKQTLSLHGLRAGVFGAALVLSVSALAQTNYEVRITPDKLQTLAGATAVHEKIRETARKVCPNWSVQRDMASIRACRSDVMNDIVAQINNPLLTSVHDGEPAATIAQAD